MICSDRVSVVIPSRNRLQRLTVALRTALGQVGVDHEILVVDDGSTDGTSDYIQSLGEPRVRVFRHAVSAGVAAARNTGIEHAQGEWIAFLDDDDLWSPDKLRMQLSSLDGYSVAGWSCTGSVHVDIRGELLGWHQAPASGNIRGRLSAIDVVPGGGSGVLVASSLLREVGGFDPRLSLLADFDMWIRLADRSPVAAVNRPLVAYVEHGSNMTARSPSREREMFLLEEKHWSDVLPVSTILMRAALAGKEGGRRASLDVLMRHAWRHPTRRAAPRLLSEACGVGRRKLSRKVGSGELPLSWRLEAEGWLQDAGLK